jgi:hypothetical protein
VSTLRVGVAPSRCVSTRISRVALSAVVVEAIVVGSRLVERRD